MTRKDIYQKIKKEDLADDINKFFGKNYTNVKTELLQDWLDTHWAIEEVKVPNIETNSETIKNDEPSELCSLFDGFKQLISTLVAHRAITPIEGEELMDVVFK